MGQGESYIMNTNVSHTVWPSYMNHPEQGNGPELTGSLCEYWSCIEINIFPFHIRWYKIVLSMRRNITRSFMLDGECLT